MRTLEIKMQLTPPNLFERFAGVRCGFETTITDWQLEVVGRGPTPEAAHEVGISTTCSWGSDVSVALAEGRRDGFPLYRCRLRHPASEFGYRSIAERVLSVS